MSNSLELSPYSHWLPRHRGAIFIFSLPLLITPQLFLFFVQLTSVPPRWLPFAHRVSVHSQSLGSWCSVHCKVIFCFCAFPLNSIGPLRQGIRIYPFFHPQHSTECLGLWVLNKYVSKKWRSEQIPENAVLSHAFYFCTCLFSSLDCFSFCT